MRSERHSLSSKPGVVGSIPAGRASFPSESTRSRGRNRPERDASGPHCVPDSGDAKLNEKAVRMPRPDTDRPSVLGALVWGGRTRLQRFWEKVEVRGADECWEWAAARVQGYGHLGDWRNILRNRQYAAPVRAHVLSWAIANDRWPTGGEVVRHRCDNPACCNPAHLLIGSHKDNMRDARERRRHPVWAASDDRAAELQREIGQLTVQRAALVRALTRIPQPSSLELARERGVSRQAVEQMLKTLEADGVIRRQRYAVLVSIESPKAVAP